MLNRDGVPSKDLVLSKFPSNEILVKSKAITECYEEIPCNPCSTVCPFDAIYIGEDINATYTFAYTSTRNPTGVNISQIQEQFGLFVTGLLAFLAIIGTIIGVVWLVFYVKQLFDKKDGLQGITA